jgi:protein-S-isoprenylcysteine O-methyltransferase Ste14
MPARDRGPGVPFPPPFVFLAGGAGAWLLHRWIAFEIDGDGAGPVQEKLGALLAVAGFGLMLWGIATFARAGTAIVPYSPATALVHRGPYRFTRNPMYVGLTVGYIGLALLLNSAWALLLLPLVLAALSRFVIRREERHLRSAFGSAYEDYCRRVRRWV